MCISSVFFLSDLYRGFVPGCSILVGAQFLYCIGSMPVYSIPLGYVHKFCVLPLWFVWSIVPACSIPIGYVHKFGILTCLTIFWMKDPPRMLKDSLGSMICWEVYWWWFWLTMKSWWCAVHWGRGRLLGISWWCVAH